MTFWWYFKTFENTTHNIHYSFWQHDIYLNLPAIYIYVKYKEYKLFCTMCTNITKLEGCIPSMTSSMTSIYWTDSTVVALKNGLILGLQQGFKLVSQHKSYQFTHLETAKRIISANIADTHTRAPAKNPNSCHFQK